MITVIWYGRVSRLAFQCLLPAVIVLEQRCGRDLGLIGPWYAFVGKVNDYFALTV